LANEVDIYVRSGQLCNPGGIAGNLGFETWHMTRLWSYGHRYGGAHNIGTEIVNGKPTGVVRVSLGVMTTIANIDTLMAFLRDEFVLNDYRHHSKFRKNRHLILPLAQRWIEAIRFGL
jgi:molybdenum cofactor sulfurtransferase